ncbi:relaxase/mobilization nuclease [Streptomyces sp. NPDC057002]|uniref:relaxase/mobilization nuclease n=1 Tax=Streptomyces sp. NPDC057002 TaxID=3345992 RepID=UPI00362A4822
MIPRLYERTHTPHDPLEEALGRPVSPHEGLTLYTVVAHRPGLDRFALDEEQKTWTSLQWAKHLEDPYAERPFATGPDGDRRAILHLDIRLHPDDRVLTGPEWAEVAHRLARAAGIEVPGKEHGCRWIAVQAQHGRLDLIANLIHSDGAWHAPPTDILRRLSDEARRRTSTWSPYAPDPLRGMPSARHRRHRPSSRASSLSSPTSRPGPLATVRGLVEHTAHRIARQPGAVGNDTAHRLELIARRLHTIQQDLDTTAARLLQPPAAAVPPAVRHTAHRSP